MEFLEKYLADNDIAYEEKNCHSYTNTFKVATNDSNFITIQGYGSIHSYPDLAGDIIPKTAYDFKLYKDNPLVSYDHLSLECAKIIGYVDIKKIKVDNHGVLITAMIDRGAETQEAKQVVRNIELGIIKAFSIGAYVQWEDKLDRKGSRVAKKVIPYDFSVVTRPACITKVGGTYFKTKQNNKNESLKNAFNNQIKQFLEDM